MDPQPGALRQHEQLGIEEPGLVLDHRKEATGGVGSDSLEPALRILEPCP